MRIEENIIYNNSIIRKKIPYSQQLEEYFAGCKIESTESKEGKDTYYESLKRALQIATTAGKDYCHLVSYIANYPSRYPIPNQSEQDERMERLLEESDILPTYLPWDDLDEIFIRGTDITRIEEALMNCYTATQELMFAAQHPNPIYLSDSIEEEVREKTRISQTSEQKQGKSYRISMKGNLMRLRGGK